MADDAGVALNLDQQIDRALKVIAIFEKTRCGRRPWAAQGACPFCRRGVVQYRYGGPRAQRVWCSTPGCLIALS